MTEAFIPSGLTFDKYKKERSAQIETRKRYFPKRFSMPTTVLSNIFLSFSERIHPIEAVMPCCLNYGYT